MHLALRKLLLAVSALPAFGVTGCALVPRSRLDQAQAYNRELQQKNQELAGDLDRTHVQAQELASKNAELENRLTGQDELLAGFQDRISGFQSERDQLQHLYDDALGRLQQQPANLSPEVRGRLADFARRHPEFVEVDPESGISKFRSDVLFRVGESELTQEGQQALQEFASIFRTESARQLRLMVVGHTDDRPIVKNATAARHPTNWHLSVHRAVAVEQYLEKSGIESPRMGVAGFGQHQPIAMNSSTDSRQKNRRVEIYVLGPEVPIVGSTSGRRQY